MNTSLHQRSGEQALRDPYDAVVSSPPGVIDCSFCPATIHTDAVYHRMIVGMNEDGASSTTDAARTVEEVSELCICSECYPRIDVLMDGFLERLWNARQPDLSLAVPSGAPAETEPSLADTQPLILPGVTLTTPFGPVSGETVDVASQIIELARRVYEQSPEGFLLGLVVGRLLASGLSEDDIHGIVTASVHAAIGPAPTEGASS